MDKPTLILLAEACMDEAEALQDRRNETDADESRILNLSLRAQIMRDLSSALQRAAKQT